MSDLPPMPPEIKWAHEHFGIRYDDRCDEDHLRAFRAGAAYAFERAAKIVEDDDCEVIAKKEPNVFHRTSDPAHVAGIAAAIRALAAKEKA